MKSNYRKLGDFIKEIDRRNIEDNRENLLGLSVSKCFIPSIANTVGTDFKKYKIIERGQFAYIPDTSRRGDKIAIALLKDLDFGLLSNVYTVFEVSCTELLPEYLELWFKRSEFDRYARFKSHGSVREIFDWEQLCDVELPVPSKEEQIRTVASFRALDNRIEALEQLNDKLAALMNGLFEACILTRSSSTLPKNWRSVKLGKLCEKIGSGATPRGGKSSYLGGETALIRSMNVFDYRFSYANLAHIADAQAKKLDNVAVQPYDVLLNITGVSVARCCIVPEDVLPARVNQHVMILRAYNQDPHVSFLIMCSLCNQFYKQQLLGISQSGSTREAINKGEMEEFEIMVPDRYVLTKFGQSAQSIYRMMQISLREVNMLNNAKELLLAHLA